MANDLVPYSQALSDPATTASSLESTDVIAIAREDSARPTGFKSMVTRLLTLAKKIVSGIDYSTELTETDAKTITGAINEVAQNSGSVDITTAINTPASVQTFANGGDNIPLKSLVTEIVPVQSGSGVPSPQNVRSISGFANVNVIVGGGNLFDNTATPFKTGQYISGVTGNTISYTSNSNYNVYKIPVSSNVLIRNIKANTPRFVLCDSSDVVITQARYIDWAGADDPKTFIISNTTNGYLLLSVAVDGTYKCDDILNVYQGVINTIPLGQTVYGGSLECVEGEGQSNLGIVDLGDLSWTMGSVNIGFYANLPTAISPISSGDINAICSCYERTDSPSITVGLPDLTFCLSDGNLTTQKRLFIRDDSYNGDANAFKIGVTGQKLVYTLDTPISLSVSGANIPTLSGVNNIYTDCGDIQSLEYFNNKADDIASMVRLMTRS